MIKDVVTALIAGALIISVIVFILLLGLAPFMVIGGLVYLLFF